MSDWDPVRHLPPHVEGEGLTETERSFSPAATADKTLDSELEAAIEYKIATDGMDGVTAILDLISEAVRRRGALLLDQSA